MTIPRMGRPVKSISVAPAVIAASWLSLPTRTIRSSPTMPHAMWVLTMKARPPNILRSSKSVSSASSSRARPARSSS